MPTAKLTTAAAMGSVTSHRQRCIDKENQKRLARRRWQMIGTKTVPDASQRYRDQYRVPIRQEPSATPV
jgi:hypothetical protein